MALYQNAVLNKYLSEQNKDILESQYALYKSYFLNTTIQHNIIKSKEEEFQEGFLRELFVKILGYTINPEPDFNLRTELKNEKDSKKADGAIINGDKVLAVIELKSTTTTDLNKIEIQAFNYKNNQQDCRYVITSNFQKLRFYIDNAIEFLEWDLFKLDFHNFKILYLCLSRPNIFNDIPGQIKKESLTEEENVTKKLYKEYSNFRKSLFNNIVELNPAIDKLLLFKKTQKLLDRFLFLLFAEDRMLVPPNSVRVILEQWTKLKEEMDAYQPLYNRFKLYFGYLNTGHTGKLHDIFAYNGGLFAEDEILDVLIIDDTILYDATLGLSRYDYNSEVDVNILGHIFEHSLTEIEELEREITSNESPTSKATKRKKDGVFYTPKYITKYIVENTVGALCKSKKEELKIEEEEYHPLQKKKAVKVLLDNLNTYKEWLLHITIVDPACGSGAFLNQALEFLIAEHKWISELEANITGSSIVFDVENSILENNLFGVDINEESVEIAKLSLWLRTARKGRKLNSLNNNIKCGNSLINDVNIAGDKAFDWQNEFPQIFKKGGFDIVVGNPPYVRHELLSDYKDYFSKTYKVYNFSSDLFAYFYEKAFSVLKPNGLFSFISNTFDKTTAGIDLRRYLKMNTKFVKLIDFTQIQIFEGATTYPIILIAQNNVSGLEANTFDYARIPSNANSKGIDIDYYNKTQVLQDLLDENNWTFRSIQANDVANKMQKYRPIREQFGKCYYGVKTSLNEAFIINNGFELNEHIKYIYEGKELDKWATYPAEQKLILFKSKWTKSEYGTDISEEQALAYMKRDFPEYFDLLLPFEEQARKRFDKGDFWWELRNCAYYSLFEKPKIIFPNLQNTNKFCYDETGTFLNAPAVFIPTESKSLLAILNSKLVWYFLTSICVVRSGGYIEVKPQYFEQIPIPDIELTNEIPLASKAESNIRAVKELQDASYKFQKTLQRKFDLVTLPKKLENWYLLTYSDFIKELSKQKIKLTLQQESEWMPFFEMEKLKVVAIIKAISKTDKEIDKMVYQLYGLTEEEIEIVEQS